MFRHLYIHLPYCVVKCPYCDFFSVGDDHRADEFADLFTCEFDMMVAEHGPFSDVETVFLGGGTPTHLNEREIIRIGEIIRDRIRLVDGYEWTVEANPESASCEKLRLFREMGANRISLGVQSFGADDLRALGRAHSAEDAERAIDAIHRCGFALWSLDLMFGIAGQSVRSWGESVAHALALDPPHISAYALMIEPGSRYAADSTPTRFQADDDTTVDQYTVLMDTLGEAGYEHYEVSNYAKSGQRCRHNEAYWLREPYIGLGPSAHSYSIDINGAEKRWWNVRSIDGYLDRLGRGESVVAGSEELGPHEIAEERIMLGLRRSEGIRWDSIPADRVESVWRAIEPLIERRLMLSDDIGFRIARDGWAVADMLIRRAVDAVDTDSP